MKTKWYACALLVVFIFLGAIQENTTVPNQEIVLEFVDLKLAKKDIENTIYSVKERLLEAGASNIKVQETKNGALKISYYSIVNVANIKEALSKDNLFGFNSLPIEKNEKDFPFSNKLSTYNIDVYELNLDTNLSNFDGNSILEIKYDSQRYANPQNYASIEDALKSEANNIFEVAYKANKSLLIIKDNTLHLKPEVRAGPTSYYI